MTIARTKGVSREMSSTTSNTITIKAIHASPPSATVAIVTPSVTDYAKLRGDREGRERQVNKQACQRVATSPFAREAGAPIRKKHRRQSIANDPEKYSVT